jgi:hypothetical protein
MRQLRIKSHSYPNQKLISVCQTDYNLYNEEKIFFIQDGWLLCFYGFCSFFGTIKFLRLCRFNHRLLLFNQTLQYAKIELLSFIFLSFLCLFYLLFISKLFSCSTLLRTTQMLFEMILFKFDSSQLT